jgi:glutaredoxin
VFLCVLLGKKKDKKSHRSCPFCKKDKSKLSLHIRTVHRQDERVRFVMALPISRYKIFDAFKKEGILMKNREILVDDSITNKQLHLKKERKNAK